MPLVLYHLWGYLGKSRKFGLSNTRCWLSTSMFKTSSHKSILLVGFRLGEFGDKRTLCINEMSVAYKKAWWQHVYIQSSSYELQGYCVPHSCERAKAFRVEQVVQEVLEKPITVFGYTLTWANGGGRREGGGGGRLGAWETSIKTKHHHMLKIKMTGTDWSVAHNFMYCTYPHGHTHPILRLQHKVVKFLRICKVRLRYVYFYHRGIGIRLEHLNIHST